MATLIFYFISPYDYLTQVTCCYNYRTAQHLKSVKTIFTSSFRASFTLMITSI